MCIGSSEGCHLHLWCILPIVGMQRPSSETSGGSNPKHEEHMLSRPWPPDGRLQTRHQYKTTEVWQPKKHHNLNFGTQKCKTKVRFAGPKKDLIPKNGPNSPPKAGEFWRPGMSPRTKLWGPTTDPESLPKTAQFGVQKLACFGAQKCAQNPIFRGQKWTHFAGPKLAPQNRSLLNS